MIYVVVGTLEQCKNSHILIGEDGITCNFPETLHAPEDIIDFISKTISSKRDVLINTLSPTVLNAIEVLGTDSNIVYRQWIDESIFVVDGENLDSIYKRMAKPFQVLENIRYE